MGDGPNDRGLSAYHIRQACDASLRRLKTDHIDLYQMHHIDRNTPLEEIWQAMEQLIRQGKIIYVGSSNFPAWYIAQANTLAAGRNFLGLVCEQCLYNLTARTVELEVLPVAEALGLAVIAWSPLSSGVLGGIVKWSDSQSGRQRAKSRRNQQSQLDKLERYRPQLEKWEQFCDQLGSQPAAVALAWLLANPVVTAPIIGPRTIEQLTDSLEALDVKLDDDAMKRLDDIWPGPGGAAPEAYSW